MKKLKTAFLTVLAAVAAKTAFAAFEPLGAGARGPAMGDAVSASVDDVTALYYNPAGLALIGQPQLGTSYGRLYTSLDDGSNVSASFLGFALPLPDRRWGTSAVGWQQLNIDPYYREETFSLSHGGRWHRELAQAEVLLGGSAKLLRRSFGGFPEAGNAKNGLAATGLADPALAKNAMTAFDLDLGTQFRWRRHYSAGLALSHVPEPNVGFASGAKDPLYRRINLGMSYRSILSILNAEYSNRVSGAGTRDHVLTLGAERLFPQLFIGDLIARGSLGIGSRGYRRFTFGLGYATRRLTFDYAFLLPLGSWTTADSHRVAVSFRFGSPKAPEEGIEMVLAAMQELKLGKPPEAKFSLSRATEPAAALLEEHLAFASALQQGGKYERALDRLAQALGLKPGEPALQDAFNRLNVIARVVPELPRVQLDPAEAALNRGILAYLSGDPTEAMLQSSYAAGLDPNNQLIAAGVKELERATGLTRLSVPQVSTGTVEAQRLLLEANNELDAGRYDQAIQLAEASAELDPESRLPWEVLGIAQFALGNYGSASRAWERELALDRNPARRELVKGYLETSERRRKAVEKATAAQAAPPSDVPAPIERPASAERVTPASRPPAARTAASAEAVRLLYKQGIAHYVAGRLEQARQKLEEVLRLDPENVPARKALKRIKDESGAAAP